MKRILLTLICSMFWLIPAMGQIKMTLSSKAELIPDDADAASYYRMTDINDNVCAIIKVVPDNPLSGQLVLNTKGGMVPVKSDEQARKNGEWWFWVSPTVTNIMFTCDGYTSTGWIGVSLKQGSVYTVGLSVESKVKIVKEFTGSGLVPVHLTVSPSDALVTYGESEDRTINSVRITDGYFDTFLAAGTYYFRVDNKYYKSYTANVKVDRGMEEIHVILEPIYNSLAILSEPSGAEVLLDGESLGVTPVSPNVKVLKGEHTLQYKKSDYYIARQTIVANGDGSVISVPLMKLDPQFGTIVLACEDKQATLIITDPSGKVMFRGKNGDEVKLNSKLDYRVESSRTSHISQSVGIIGSTIEGKRQTVRVEPPLPIYGELQLSSIPSRAEVYIDGVYSGTTLFGDRVLVGLHEVELRADGYIPQSFTVVIKEGQILSLEKKLTKMPGKPSTNKTTKVVPKEQKKPISTGSKLGAIGGVSIGYVPYFSRWSFGAMLGIAEESEVGLYAKFRSNFVIESSFYDKHKGESFDSSEENVNFYNPVFFESGKNIQKHWVLTAGGVFPLFDYFPLSVYVGVGYGAMKNYWKKLEGDYVYITNLSRRGISADLGFILFFEDMAYMNIGVTTTRGYADIDFGVGFCF